MSARATAIANENASIDASRERAIATRDAEARPRTALEAMARRLEVHPTRLKNVLSSTVFKECRSDEELLALIIVANEYRLNPLTKEIYAFPAKGGGIVPMVSVDGWIRIMNEHTDFDGIEFDYHNDDKGGTVAIESVIYHKGRAHPVKTIEYMDECKGNTLPWQKAPRRMLRHRALIQGARIAFGFSGIGSEGDEEFGSVITVQPQTLPSRQSIEEELDDEIPRFDKQTGEIIEDAEVEDAATDSRGMTEVDEGTARELDAGDQSEAEDAAQTVNDIDGPLENDTAADAPAWQAKVDEIKGGVRAAKNASYLKKVEQEFLNHHVGFPKEVADEVEAMISEKRKALSSGEGA